MIEVRPTALKAAFNDTDTDSPDTPTSLRLTSAIFSLREDPRDDVGVGVGVVECGL